MNSTPLSRYFAYSFFILGISATQGPHQVAQKSITTTFPRRSFIDIVDPLIASVNSSSNGLPTASSLLRVPRAVKAY